MWVSWKVAPQMVWRVLRVVLLVLALWLAIEMLALQGPDPEVTRHVLDVPSEHDLGPRDCAPYC